MALRGQLIVESAAMHGTLWAGVDARVVPAPANLQLGLHYKRLDRAAVLYTDLDGSTDMVDSKRWEFSAGIYKSFLNAAAKIVKSNAGPITAYDGDRLMAIFIGDQDCINAVKAALDITSAVQDILQPALRASWNTDFVMRHTTGIDVSELRAVRTGVRGDNDIVWVGRAANHAAKLTTQSSSTPTWITAEVWERLGANLRWKDGQSIWQGSIVQGRQVYSTRWLRRFA